jgi:CarD family transcriptional regulator
VTGPPARRDEPQELLPALEGIIQSAAELAPGDRVVYPNQGVCKVTGLERKEISGQRLDLVKMTREEDGAAVMVPTGKVPAIGLRRVASGNQIEGVFQYLGASYDNPELDWKVRHRDNADRMVTGGVLGVAEVVKGLHALSRIRPLPTKEREQYDNARHLLVNEVAVSLGVPRSVAEDYIDYALVPPAGVKFDLKPPPSPVTLPIHPYRQRHRPPVTVSEEDLGLAELGLDLGELGSEEPAGTENAAEEATAATAGEPEAGEAAKAREAPAISEPKTTKAKKAARAAPKRSATGKPAAKKAPVKKPSAKKRAAAKKAPRGKKK